MRLPSLLIRKIAWAIGGLVLAKDLLWIMFGVLLYGLDTLLPSFTNGNITPYVYIYALSYLISLKNTLFGGILIVLATCLYMNFSTRFGFSFFSLTTFFMVIPGLMLIVSKFINLK